MAEQNLTVSRSKLCSEVLIGWLKPRFDRLDGEELSLLCFVSICVPKGSSKRVSSSTWCGVGLVVPQISSSLIRTSESRDVHCPGPSWQRNKRQGTERNDGREARQSTEERSIKDRMVIEGTWMAEEGCRSINLSKDQVMKKWGTTLALQLQPKVNLAAAPVPSHPDIA